MHFEPILPKKKIIDVKDGPVLAALNDFGLSVVSQVSKYPPAHASYKRTGTLGKSWTKDGPHKEGNTLAVIVGTNVQYAPNVQGFKTKTPKQTALFAGYGWPSLETVANEEWKKCQPRIQAALSGK